MKSNELDISLKIVDRKGNVHIVDAPIDMGLNLMDIVRMYDLAPDGTIGVCGGIAMCASCQCYILSSHKLLDKSDEEEAMLGDVIEVKRNSRLACQIQINSELEGLAIELAPAELD
ncbi:MAG: ferredoxin [Flavobacteriaceae bacterium]|nr:ferredoxin [Flavobacteriaceae bacterium]|tara:strand:+ start:1006 stop:1353 length:348 start_codon:yes stop_codon:yes gene_type:complete